MRKIFAAFMVMCLTNIAHAANYVGSDACQKCHFEEYNQFIVSGHPYILFSAQEAKERPIPLPEGYEWEDISYVIGGNPKKARYVDKDGYVLTAGKDGAILKTQYNVETGTWSYFKKQKKLPYKCAKCHTTGYQKKGHQDNRKGIVGTWKLQGVQCEACHGPASNHVKSEEHAKKHKLKKIASAKFCGQCHLRGESQKIEANNGFIRSREQFSELLASPHAELECVKCHNQHGKPSLANGIRKNCKSCHKEQATVFKESTHFSRGVECLDCHMPRAVKAAVTKSKTEADMRSHLVKINTNPKAAMFSDDGKFGLGYLTLKFACLNCHKNKDAEWASSKAKGVHGVGGKSNLARQ